MIRRVHGVIFAAFSDFVLTRHGADVAKEILAGSPAHQLSEAYADEEFFGLVERACERTGVPTDRLVHDFGVFAGSNTFPRLYPAFFSLAGSSRAFLLTIEDRIHELVRATIPDASPPQLDVQPLGEDGVRIIYTSPRQLCTLLEGLVEGTAAHYEERADVEQSTCMLRGDQACLVDVRLAPSA
jgi:Haem-NO-binding